MCACMRACVRASVRCLMLPNAKFVGNPSGSVTASSFAFFVSECYGKHAREVLRIPMDQSLVLILDTGGGCLLHLNAHVLRAAMKWNIRLFYLPAYGTRALMPLDQNSHQAMASDWQAFKRSWSNKQEPLTLCVALRAVHAFTSRSLGPRMAKVSWKRIGIEADQPLNRDILFVTRASEIFSTVREKQQPQPQSAALSIFKEVSPKKAKCKGKGCGQLLSSNMKICFNCGLQNPEPILLSRICVLRSAKASLFHSGLGKK